MSGLEPVDVDELLPGDLAALVPEPPSAPAPPERCPGCGGPVTVLAVPPECRRYAESIWTLVCDRSCAS